MKIKAMSMIRFAISERETDKSHTNLYRVLSGGNMHIYTLKQINKHVKEGSGGKRCSQEKVLIKVERNQNVVFHLYFSYTQGFANCFEYKKRANFSFPRVTKLFSLCNPWKLLVIKNKIN